MMAAAGSAWLYNDAIVIGIPLIGVLAWCLIYPAYRALRGSWRSWVNAPPYLPWQASLTNTWPFMLLCMGLALVVAMPSLVFEALGWEAARKFMWNGPFWIPWIGAIVGIFWWPKGLGPAWYRTWRNAGGERSIMPFTPEDTEAVRRLPEGKRRRRLEKNIEACRVYCAQDDE